MFVIAARKQRPGPSRLGLPERRPDWLDVATEPVGVQHAAPSRPDDRAAVTRARCGTDLTGWRIFGGRRFDPNASGVCQRCAELVTRPVRRGGKPSEIPEALGALTNREREILGYLADMLTAEEIAVLMATSVSEVRAHTRSILRELASLRRNKATPRGPNLRIIRG